MSGKLVLITLCREEVAPRFDMTAEVLIAPLAADAADAAPEGRHLVLAHASGEELCDLAIGSGVSVVVCGGIEEDYYHYLRWKRIDVICDVMGPADAVLARLRGAGIRSGDRLYEAREPA